MKSLSRATAVLAILAAVCMTLSASAATITNQPTGDGLWSTATNWIGGVAPSNGDSVVLLTSGGYAPTNVDIANLAIDNLTFPTNLANDTTGLTIIGNEFKFNNINCWKASGTLITNVIKQNVYMMKTQPWFVNASTRLIFEGVLGATNDTYAVQANGTGYVQLMNTNTFAGGLQQNQTEASFFRDANIGRVPAIFQTNYFQSNNGQYRVFTTAGFNKVVIHPNRGFLTGGERFVSTTTVK